MKTTRSRARRLKIATSHYSPAKGSRATHCLERTPGVGLEEWGVVAKWSGEVPSHHFTLTIFGKLRFFFVSFLLLCHCFVILIKYSRTQKGQKYSFLHHLSLYCSKAKRLFEWFEVFLLCLLYENSIKLHLKGDSSLNRPRHLLMLRANHLLCIIGVGF